MNIREYGAPDAAALENFFRRIPADDLTFAKEDPLAPGLLQEWLRDSRALRLLAIDDEDQSVIGYVAVIPGVGLSGHVGELRLLVDPARRRWGVGKALARQALANALGRQGLRKIMVEVVAEQEPAIRMFRSLGFVAEAVLVDQLMDPSGQPQDLVLLAHFAEDNQSRLDALGIASELA
ncbi:MAG: GNAT family N-acetyltransferase [Panacagrimonas sp.]